MTMLFKAYFLSIEIAMVFATAKIRDHVVEEIASSSLKIYFQTSTQIGLPSAIGSSLAVSMTSTR